MARYLVLYQSEAARQGGSVQEALAGTPPAQLQAGMALWRRWHEACAGHIADPAAPLGRALELTEAGAAEAPSAISGFTVLEAGSRDEAAALMRDHPHFRAPGASILILEGVAMPGGG